MKLGLKRESKTYLLVFFGLMALYALMLCLVRMGELADMEVERGLFLAGIRIEVYLAVVFGLIAGICIGYAITSKGCRISFKEFWHSKTRPAIFIVEVLACSVAAYGLTFTSLHQFSRFDFSSGSVAQKEPAESEENSQETVSEESEEQTQEPEKEEPKANLYQQLIDGQQSFNGESFQSDVPDQSIFLLTNDSTLSLAGCTLNKNGDIQNSEEAFGLNAAIVLQKDSRLESSESNITTTGIGSSAIAMEQAQASFSYGTFASQGDDSPVLYMKDSNAGLDHTTLNSSANNSALVLLDGGQMSLSHSSQQSQGENSPLIAGSGSVSAEALQASSSISPFVTLSKGGSASIADSILAVPEQSYESLFTFEKKEGVSALSISDSIIGPYSEYTAYNSNDYSNLDIDITNAIFSLDNAEGSATLSGNLFALPLGKLASLIASSLSLNLNGQLLSGDITIDEESKLALNMVGSSFTGSINTDGQKGLAVVNMDASSVWTLSADTYISELNNDNPSNTNIYTNGYTLYVDGEAL